MTDLDQRDLLGRLWVDAPLLALDFEATGTDPYSARPVSVALVKVTPALEVTTLLSTLVWCGEPIPEDAARVHGVTSERARKEGRHPCAILGRLDLALEAHPDAPLAIFNAGYDLTLLRSEWARWDNPDYYERALARRVILDPLVWSKHYEPYRKGGERRLSALCGRFGVTLDAAHEAGADAVAAAALAFAMARTHVDLARRPLAEFAAWQDEKFLEWRDGLNAYWVRKGVDRRVGGTWLEPERLAPPSRL